MVKNYRVHGFALVPVTVEMLIQARTPAEAIAKAQEQFKEQRGACVEGNSADYGSVFDWQPDAELVEVKA